MSTNAFANVYKPADDVAREMFSLYSKNLQNSIVDTVENALVVFWTVVLLRKLNGHHKVSAIDPPHCNKLTLICNNPPGGY